jgi:small-conductance mechanosensitive channel/CRP-like cAMP-binding protein
MADPGLVVNWWSSLFLYMVLVGFGGIAVWFLIPAHPNARLIVQIGFFVAMSAMLLAQHVIPYRFAGGNGTISASILVGLAKLLWWLHLAWALIGFVRILLVLEGKPSEERLLQDLVAGVVYVGTALSILAFVFGVPVGTLIATSGVFAIVLGLALQNTLSDLFSGIALKFGHPYALGDWIVLGDGTEGKVVETNWRSTSLYTLTNNVVALPNSFLAKLGLTNESRPDESHSLSVTVRLAPTRMPSFMAEVMHTALSSSNLILKEPPPSVAIKGLDAAAIELDLCFRVGHIGQRAAARNEIFDLVYRHSKSYGLPMANAATVSVATSCLPAEDAAKPPLVTPMELIGAIPIFSAALMDDEREGLAAKTTVRTYRKGEVIARQGETLPSLMIIRSGVVLRERNDGDYLREIGRLSPGDFFGETGLLAGVGETATLRAISHVVVYEIDQAAFAPVLLDRPEMAEDLAAILSERASSPGESSASEKWQDRSRSALLKAIRSAFRAHNANAFERVAGGNPLPSTNHKRIAKG